MSAPSYRSLEAENLTFGFLAAQAKAILNRQLQGEGMSAEDERLLDEARAFVEKLVAGEELVETGSIRGQYSRGSMKTLRMLSDPIQSLAKIGKHPSHSAYLSHLSHSLKPERIKTEQIDIEDLRSAQKFFEIVYRTVCEALVQNRDAHKRSFGRGN